MLKLSSLGLMAALATAAVLPATAQTKGPQVQFVQTAAGETFKDGVLTLKDAAAMTDFFSDRPERVIGQVRNDYFVKLWSEGKNSFKSDPPNAVLSVSKPEGQPVVAMLVLSNPRIDGKNIVYNVRTLEGQIPAEGAETTLFIDSGDMPCGSGEYNPSWSSYPCWAQKAFSKTH